MLSGVRVPKLEGSTPSVHGAKHDGPNQFQRRTNMNQREMFEKSFQRPTNYNKLDAESQWRIDDRLGILDWEGKDLTPEDMERIKAHYK